MPTATEQEKTEQKDRAPRTVVSLPDEVGKQIDELGTRISAKLEKDTGIGFQLSRAQIVHSLIRDALKRGNGADQT